MEKKPNGKRDKKNEAENKAKKKASVKTEAKLQEAGFGYITGLPAYLSA